MFFSPYIKLLVLIFFVKCVHSANWAYRGPNGPYSWREIEPECGGKAQSPINIKGGTIVSSPRPIWINYDLTPTAMKIENNGHSLVLKGEYEAGRAPYVQIGQDTFFLDNVHFHFGRDDFEGSEHAFLNKKYQLEMHAVHKRVVNGVTQSEISVFAILYSLTAQSNSGLARFLEHASEIATAETDAEVEPFAWSAVIPRFTTEFYTYKGSLTTPPCSQVVTWYIRKQLATVSRSQLQAFRLLRNEEKEEMASNFRPLQLRWGRPVYYVVT